MRIELTTFGGHPITFTGHLISFHVFCCFFKGNKFKPGAHTLDLYRVGQGFWVYGIQGLFKSGIRYIAAKIRVFGLSLSLNFRYDVYMGIILGIFG